MDGLIAFLFAQGAILGTGLGIGQYFRNLAVAIFLGGILSLLAGIAMGALFGQPAALFYFSPFAPAGVLVVGIAIGRLIRRDAVKLTSGDPRIYANYLQIQFGDPRVARLPWIAQGWQRMSAAQKIALVQHALGTAKEELIKAHDDPMKLYSAIYTASVSRPLPTADTTEVDFNVPREAP
jgi:hypothetical protein